jgi:hypothetical protein
VQLSGQQAVDMAAFRHHQQAGGVSVQPVCRPKDKGLTAPLHFIGQEIGQAIGKMTLGRVNRGAGGLF